MTDTRNVEVLVKWANGGDTTYLRTADELLTMVGDLTEHEYAPTWTTFTVTVVRASVPDDEGPLPVDSTDSEYDRN